MMMANDNAGDSARWLATCVGLLLITTFSVNLLSAFIRHHEAGLGCMPWPDCYAVIGTIEAPTSGIAAATDALTPTALVKQIHRASATALVILVLAATHLVRQSTGLPKLAQMIPYLMIAVVLLLAVVGPASYRKTLPAIATINLVGGMLLLALCHCLWVSVRGHPMYPPLPVIGRLRWWVLGLLSGQVILGAWVSANFAGNACAQTLRCSIADVSIGEAMRGFWFWRELTVDDVGRIVMDDSQRYVQWWHRFGAVVGGGAVFLLALARIRVGGGAAVAGIVAMLLLLMQLALGSSTSYFGPGLAVALAHNAVASLLILSVLHICLTGRR